MPFAEDLSIFVSDFGDVGTLDGYSVRGIFETPGVSLGLVDVAVAAVQPQFQMPTASVPPAAFGKTLVIPQGSFVVREHIPDGTGMSLLLLTKA